MRAGRPQVAIDTLRSELQRQPADAHRWFLLGACHDALGEHFAAAEAFSRSLALEPSNLEAHLAYISVLRAAGNVQGALAASRHALVRLSNQARLLYAAALSLEDAGRLDDALAHYDGALERALPLADAHHNRGLLLMRTGRLEEAEINQRRFIAAHPRDKRAHSGLADVLLALGRCSEALEILDGLASDDAMDVGVCVRRGVALASLRRLDEAREVFVAVRMKAPSALGDYLRRIAQKADPALLLSPENVFLWQCHLAQGRCDWRHWADGAEELRRVGTGTAVEPAIAFVAFHQALDGRERLAIAVHIASGIEGRIAAMPPPRAGHRAHIRIGILSPDLREHLNGYLLTPLFELLDRKRFELYAYALSTNDGSKIRSNLEGQADRFRELAALSDQQAAAAIRGDDIDILVDVAGHTTAGRFAITAQRPARLQVLYLGFPGSLGSKRVDHVIVDRVVGMKADEWTEIPIFLPHTYYLYDFRNPAPQIPLSRSDYGLPAETFVYCAFHKAEKISPEAFDLSMEILGRTPRAVLWLLALPNVAQRNLRREAAKHGIDTSRLIFAPFDPRDRYLARQRLGDLMLDTLYHSAMTTACDAMAAGLPVLTLPGNAMASRAGESLARAAGVPEMVVPDRNAYVDKAVFLAENPEALQRTREKLIGRSGPLFDTVGRVRELENAFLEMWRQYHDQEPR